MADDEVTPRAGELTTANYGWTKPTVGASDDQWGGYLNTDLDGIDSVVHGIDVRPPYVLPTASTTVLGGVKVDGSTISISGGVISGTAPQGPPVTISDTPPASPQVGALWWNSNATGSGSGQLYTWFNDGNSSQWVSASNDGGVIPPASTTMLGGVKVDGTTIKAATDGTISTTVVPIGDNRIINGDMRIDARNNGVSGTAVSVFTVDRWYYSATQASKGTWQRNLGGPATVALGLSYFLAFTSSSAYASISTDAFIFQQAVEADMVTDFAWGSAGAQSVTLSFWVQSTLTGTFSGCIRNAPAPSTRSYPFTFSIPTATTWCKIAVTIPGDTAGTWVMSGSAAALYVCFDLGCGSTLRGPANAWASANYVGATGAVSVVSTNGAAFFVTGVKLEIGSVATPFNRQSLAKSMADCQRYYQKLGGDIGLSLLFQGYTQAAGQSISSTVGISAMRAAPTVTRAGTWTNVANLASYTLNGGLSTLGVQMISTAAGQVTMFATAADTITLSADL